MSVSDVKETVELIEKIRKQYAGSKDNPCCFNDKKIDPVWIDEAECLLNLKFPADYRYFLEHLGAGDIFGSEFYGIMDKGLMVSGIPNVVWLTLEERESPYGKLPNYFLPVYDLGIGDYYVLDCRDPENTPLYIWMPGFHEEGDELEIIADSFGAFFKETIFEAKKAEEEDEKA